MNKFISDDGYVLCYVPEHPFANGGYVAEHRLVMEEFVGFFLELDIVVHHIDFDKQHNVPENLFLTTPMEHSAIHNRYKTMDLAKRQRIRTSMRKNKLKRKNEPVAEP